MEKSRVRNLTTRYLGIFKYGSYLLLLVGLTVVFVLIIKNVMRSSDFLSIAVNLIVFVAPIAGALSLRKLVTRTKRVEFDDEFLYVIEEEVDTLVPLANIKSVELISVAGIFQVNFFQKEKWGEFIYFKPSLLYPLNFGRKDGLVDVLRSSIQDAKRKHDPSPKNALHS